MPQQQPWMCEKHKKDPNNHSERPSNIQNALTITSHHPEHPSNQPETLINTLATTLNITLKTLQKYPDTLETTQCPCNHSEHPSSHKESFINALETTLNTLAATQNPLSTP